jgi:2-desacetyl-2-hydroxyethyl bacteriochlorophyllide A dehydrogenase
VCADFIKSPIATAVWFPRRRAVELREEEVPSVGPDEIRVRTLASGISQGTEMLVYRGDVDSGLALDLPTLSGSFALPIKYGYASVGQIEEAGSQIGLEDSRFQGQRIKEGDLVFVHHPHQTEFVVPASMAVVLPETLDPECGVFFANAETALNVVLDAHPRLGDRIVIFGQGVVGLLITQMTRLAGARPIIAVEPAKKRQELSRLAGADAVLDPQENLGEQVRDLTDGIGADIVIEASGNPEALTQALDCAATQGMVVVCSWYGTKSVSVPLGGHFHRGRLRIVSSQIGMLDPGIQPRWSRDRRASTARDLLEQLELLPLITHRIPFADAAEAYRIVDEHPDDAVQVVLTYV